MEIRFLNGVMVRDAREAINYYFQEMGLGRQYAEWVYSPENRRYPHRLLMKNWNAASFVRARGMAWAIVGPLISDDVDDLVPLSHLDPDADLLLDWPMVRSGLGKTLDTLLRLKGVARANATKLLHQKRPALIPILDTSFCRMLRIPNSRTTDEVLISIDAVRSAMLQERTLPVLRSLKSWLLTADHLPIYSEVRSHLSLVRIFDIVAWSAERSSHYQGPDFSAEPAA